jgi:hypothetical protein
MRNGRPWRLEKNRPNRHEKTQYPTLPGFLGSQCGVLVVNFETKRQVLSRKKNDGQNLVPMYI